MSAPKIFDHFFPSENCEEWFLELNLFILSLFLFLFFVFFFLSLFSVFLLKSVKSALSFFKDKCAYHRFLFQNFVHSREAFHYLSVRFMVLFWWSHYIGVLMKYSKFRTKPVLCFLKKPQLFFGPSLSQQEDRFHSLNTQTCKKKFFFFPLFLYFSLCQGNDLTLVKSSVNWMHPF